GGDAASTVQPSAGSSPASNLGEGTGLAAIVARASRLGNSVTGWERWAPPQPAMAKIRSAPHPIHRGFRPPRVLGAPTAILPSIALFICDPLRWGDASKAIIPCMPHRDGESIASRAWLHGLAIPS